MNTSIYDGSSVPAAYVTVGRQRVKQYGNTVYLNNGNEFEIELFNPTTSKVLAKIELNGVSLGSGIVLRPGEHIFLERYLNEAKKFLFETYEVDGNNLGVQKAIANNGQVSVKFYSEYINYGITYSGGSQWTTTTWPHFNPSFIESNYFNSHTKIGSTAGHRTKSMSANYGNVSGTLSATGGIGNSVFTCSANLAQPEGLGLMGMVEMESSPAPAAAVPIETGRIEKGSNSNQSFTYDNTTFNTWYSWSSEWKILPISQKPFVQEDIKVYCTKCGAKRRKSSDKFCAKCGTKF